MSRTLLRCRRPREAARLPRFDDTPAAVDAARSDASHRSGSADAVCAPSGEGEWAGLLSSRRQVLVVGAQSSLTGGATPRGGVVATTDHLREVLHDEGERVRVRPGLSLRGLQEHLRASGRWFPPAPTHDGAFVGGAVSTDAAGARTFRHGTTRRWVRGLTVMLIGGDVVELERGEAISDASGRFLLERGDGRRETLQLPMHALPAVPKCSAGYRGGAGLDLVDLFVGSEGTLGAVLEVELDVAPLSHGELSLAVALPGEPEGLRAVAALRRIDEVAAIEFLDAGCLSLLRAETAAAGLAPGASWLLLLQLELPLGLPADEAVRQLVVEGAAGPVAEVRSVLASCGADLATGLLALPGDERTRRAIDSLRESAPRTVNALIGANRRATGAELTKIGGDAIVPFERLGELLAAARREADARGLDLVTWGHVSDANLHPNVIPGNRADQARGEDFLLAFGRAALALGGSPLAEHGVGRHPLKQALLREMVGDEALDAMRALKRALDPHSNLAPGVLFD